MKKINDTMEAFVLKLRALYDIEEQLEEALPKMEEAATSEDLKEGFRTHFNETVQQRLRLEALLETYEDEAKEIKVEGIRGIIEDGEWVIKVTAPPDVKDAMLAAAARYVEHYEMAGYMSAIAYAQALGLADAVDVLTNTLAEERAADELLASAIEKHLAAATEEEDEAYDDERDTT